MRYSSFVVAALCHTSVSAISINDGDGGHPRPHPHPHPHGHPGARPDPNDKRPEAHHHMMKVMRSEMTKEQIDLEKSMKKEKIKNMTAMSKEKQSPYVDTNSISDALQAGDLLRVKQEKEAKDKLDKLDLTSKQVPVLPAKMWDIDEAKPLAQKEPEADPDEAKDEDEEKCKAKGGNVNEKFEKLLEMYTKVSDKVEIEGYKGKWKKDSWEPLIKEVKNVVQFVRVEETKLKKDEGLMSLSSKEAGDVLVAQNHYGVTMLSQHISRILDEVHDFYELLDSHTAAVAEEAKAKAAAEAEKAKDDEKKEDDEKKDEKEDEKKEKEEDPLTPATNIQKLVDDMKKETEKLCKYDEPRCDGWKSAKEDKKKEEEKADKKKKAALADKGTDKDPNAIKGAGGAIPKTLEELKEEKEAEDDAKEEEKKLDPKTCDKCHAKDLKKKYDTPKKVNERYDVGFKGTAGDVLHHSGVDAHDTTQDYWAPTGKYHHPGVGTMGKLPNTDHDHNNEYFNDSQGNKGRVWKKMVDDTLNGPSKKDEDTKKAKGEKVEQKEAKVEKDKEADKLVKKMLDTADKAPKAAKKSTTAKAAAPKPEAKKEAPKPEAKKEVQAPKPDIHLKKDEKKPEEKKDEKPKEQKKEEKKEEKKEAKKEEKKEEKKSEPKKDEKKPEAKK